MANTIPIFPGTIRSEVTQFTSSDGTNLKTIFLAGSSGSRVDSILVYATTNVTVNLYQSIGSNDFIIGSVSITANTPTELLTTSFWDLVNRCDAKYLGANQSLKMNLSSALSSGQTVTVVVDGGDY